MIHTRFYAIRGGPNAGIYVEWDAAQTAGFMQKQGFGNAARFGTRSSAEDYAVSAPVSERRVVGLVRIVDHGALIVPTWARPSGFVGKP